MGAQRCRAQRCLIRTPGQLLAQHVTHPAFGLQVWGLLFFFNSFFFFSFLFSIPRTCKTGYKYFKHETRALSPPWCRVTRAAPPRLCLCPGSTGTTLNGGSLAHGTGLPSCNNRAGETYGERSCWDEFLGFFSGLK